MTFRELALKEELSLSSNLRKSNLPKLEEEAWSFQSFLQNQSPVMKIWFGLMVANLLLFLIFMN